MTPGLRRDIVDGAPRYTNRLANEQSPYLRQHGHNPVDWYPWGSEAFERARRENKPIFLSIGYSTCHWCHVMEEESFSNPAVADVMNRYFVSIKVDREERPDVDRVYMAYVSSVSGGGWPMSLFLTPDLAPFFGATYLPPITRGQDEGFVPILERVAATWRDDRASLLRAAAEGSSTISAWSRIPRPVDAAPPPSQVIDETFDSLTRSFDVSRGGFGGAPKFPRPVGLTFLLRYHARTGNTQALEMALKTLRAMAAGGIHDQLGGGFHRYTTDAAWRVPHFEKMLYDQAQLVSAYADAFQITRDANFEAIARETIDYVLRDLRDPSGGFYSAQDADSPLSSTNPRLGEGVFYLWTLPQIERVVGPDALPVVAYHFGLTARGNASTPGNSPEASPAGMNTLLGEHSRAETARRFSQSERDVTATLARARTALLAARATRPRPATDDTILAGWNGLMISALARAGQVFDEARYVEAARAAANVIVSRLFEPATASLKRRLRNDRADVDALLEDYAYVIQGLLDLYEASFEPRWLGLAARLQTTQDAYFWDEADGGYFSTRADAAHVLARMKEDYDGAEPAANSVSAMNLVRLWQLLERDTWRARSDSTFRALSGRLARSGSAMPQLVSALDFRDSTAKQIVIAGRREADDTRALLRLVHARFIPNKVLALVDDGASRAELVGLVPFLDGMVARDGRATIYVCENYVCRLPTTDLKTAERLLDERPTSRN